MDVLTSETCRALNNEIIRNNSTNKSQAPEDGCINIQNMLSIK